jgi:hypothetical protein
VVTFAPTVVTFPSMLSGGHSQVLTYVCQSSASVPMATFAIPPPIAPQFGVNAQVHMHNFSHDTSIFKVTTPLSTYRFPPLSPQPLVTFHDKKSHNSISEISEDEDDADNGKFEEVSPACSSDTIKLDLPACEPSEHDSEAVSSPPLALATAAPSGVKKSKARGKLPKKAQSSRGDKLPTTPQSVLLLRRSSTCAQPRSTLNTEGIPKRSKKAKAKHACKLCDQAFTRAHDLKRHLTIHEECELNVWMTSNLASRARSSEPFSCPCPVKGYPCPNCSKAFGRKDALKRHMEVRGPYHDDFSKKSAPKKQQLHTVFPPFTAKQITEFPDAADSEVEVEEIVKKQESQQDQRQEYHETSSEVSELLDILEEPQEIQAADTELKPDRLSTEEMLEDSNSSRASSVYSTSSRGDSATDLPDFPMPFNIDRKSSLVQGPPSAHLHLDGDFDILHPFMTDFPTSCGF